VQYVFENAFRFNQLGYAAAMSILLALVLLGVSLLQLRASRESRASDG
jgi:ABC-type sugar transport system permease subunit